MRKKYFIIIYTSFTRIYGICCKPFKINQEAQTQHTQKNTHFSLLKQLAQIREDAQRVHISIGSAVKVIIIIIIYRFAC